jgi:beta-glucosidase
VKRAFNPENVLSNLSLEEKAALCSGSDLWHLKAIERLGVPTIMATDGPHGLRKQDPDSGGVGLSNALPATCFPTAVALASSWDRSLLRDVGRAIGEECLQEDVAVLLGPGVNIKRNPLGGRNFEYFSEDPYLSGELAAGFILGVQSKGVGTSLKHFTANNQESWRTVVDTIVDERTLREMYLPAFEIAVKKARPWTLMCSYNLLNGTYLSDNVKMLSEILRDEWGYAGLVMSDWGATNERVSAIQAGMDLEMPASGKVNDLRIIEAVRNGVLSVDDLDRSVLRVLELIALSVDGSVDGYRYDQPDHHLLARRAAEEGMVLLKNEGDLLPLKPEGTIAVIGEYAVDPRYQGSGSSLMNPLQLETPLHEIAALVGDAGSVTCATGKPIAEAVSLARGADAVVVIAGLPALDESEAFDRSHMRLPQDELDLIDAILDVRSDAVIVLQNGSPIELHFAERARGILETYLGGEAGASALARILFGASSPGGRLAETFPIGQQDNPAHAWFPGQPRQVQYREGVFVGYRFYSTSGTEVRFPFGHGLSYTTFSWSDLSVDDRTVKCTVTNSGPRAGTEVIQLYIRDVASTVLRPALELKGFEKIFLDVGDSAEVVFELDERSFAFWDVATHGWMVEPGEFNVLLGASSTDIRLEASVVLPGTEPATAVPTHLPPELDDESFRSLLGHPIPSCRPVRPFHANTTLGEIKRTLLGSFLYRQAWKGFSRALMTDRNPVVRKMGVRLIESMPLRGMQMMSDGALSDRRLEGILLILNRHPFKGLRRLF